jgi:hypothetical protein
MDLPSLQNEWSDAPIPSAFARMVFAKDLNCGTIQGLSWHPLWNLRAGEGRWETATSLAVCDAPARSVHAAGTCKRLPSGSTRSSSMSGRFCRPITLRVHPSWA